MAKNRLARKIIHIKPDWIGKRLTYSQRMKLYKKRTAFLQKLATQIVSKFPEVIVLDVSQRGILIELPNRKRLMRRIEKQFNCELCDLSQLGPAQKPKPPKPFPPPIKPSNSD